MIVDSFRIRPRGHLLRHLVLFSRLLRLVGVSATPDQLLDLVKALPLLDLQCRQEVKDAARAMLVTSREQASLFDDAFDLYWQMWTTDDQAAIEGDMQKEATTEGDSVVRGQEQVSIPGTEAGDDSQNDLDRGTLAIYSADEVLRHKDFSDLTAEEMLSVTHLIRHSKWHTELHPTRRNRRVAHGTDPDLRLVLRQGLRYGGEVMKLAWHTPKLKHRPLIVLCDISGSMERYVRFLLRFLFVVTNGLKCSEVFVFSTRLTRLTRQLRRSEMDVALHQAAESVNDWNGGTRIGEALRSFNFNYGRQVLGHGSTVLIISDGWDRGDLDLLRREMFRLQLNCRRLIWLNPLLSTSGYEPLAQGIQAALPYIDDFLPVNNLFSLEQLAEHLENLGHLRSPRRSRSPAS